MFSDKFLILKFKRVEYMHHFFIFQNKKFLIFLFFLSLLVRALFFGCYLREDDRCIIGFDGEQYQNVAEHILHGNGIAQAPGEPNFYRLPGYPLFLACCYKILGIDLTPQSAKTSHDAAMRRPGLCKIAENVLWLQLILASFIPVLIFWLSLVLFPSILWLARCAGLWSAMHVGFVLYAGMLASESLFMIFFLLFCGLFFSQFRWWFQNHIRMSKGMWFATGIMLGCASLVRAVGHYTMVILLAMLLLSVFAMREKIIAMGCLIIGWLSIVGWWLVRNYLLTGFLFFHTLPGLHFLQYPAVHAVMGYANFGDETYFTTKKQLIAEWQALIYQQLIEGKKDLNEYEKYAIAERLAFSHIAKRPWVALKNACVQMAKTCCTMYSSLLLYVPAGTVYEEGTSLWFKIKLYLFPKTNEAWLEWLIYWEILYSFFMFLGFVAFLTSLVIEKTYRVIALTTFPLIGLFIVITLGYGCARLRMPVEPFLMIFSLLGWQSFDRIANCFEASRSDMNDKFWN